MLQLNNADDFVVATGETHTVREFADLSFKEAGMELEWCDENEHEKGIMKRGAGCIGQSGKKLVKGTVLVSVNPQYYRPTEVDLLIGDASKARSKFGWQPKTSFEELVSLMVKADLEKVARRGY